MHLAFSGVHGGLAIDAAAGGLYFEDGKTAGFVNATRIPPYALPRTPTESTAARTVGTRRGRSDRCYDASGKLTR